MTNIAGDQRIFQPKRNAEIDDGSEQIDSEEDDAEDEDDSL